MTVMVYEDGTRDCPGCLDQDVQTPNRVRGGSLAFCTRCDNHTHSEAMAGFAQMVPFMRRHLSYTDWLIEHGIDPLNA